MKELNRRTFGNRILGKNFYASNDTRETRRNNNDMVLGSPGCNKTGGIVSPSVLEAEHSMVVCDTKGLMHRKYKKYLEQKGFRVETIDFVRPERSASYNPLDYIERYEYEGEESYKEADVNRMVDVLLPYDKNSDEFWRDSAKLVIISLIAFVLEKLPRNEQNFGSVYELYTEMIDEVERKHEAKQDIDVSFFEGLGAEDGDSYAYKIYRMYKRYVVADRTWVCICAFVNTVFMYTISKETKKMLCNTETLDLADVGREKMIMFVNTPDMDRSNSRIINIFFTQLFQCLKNEADSREDGRLRVPVRVILDDFAANVKIADFDKIISVVRSRDIFITIILQSLKQLEIAYSAAEADTIMNNCDQWVYLGGGSPEMISTLAQKAGCLPETIGNMDYNHEWIFIRGEKPRLIEKEPAYALENRIFNKEEEM